MKLNIPILLSIVALSISIALIIVTFALQYWLVNKTSDSNNNTYTYGMWSGCLKSDQCYYWYGDAESMLKYTLNSYYKAFQGLQCCMLGLIAIAIVSLFVNLKWCSNLFTIFFIDALLVLIGASCGIASIIMFGVKVYDSNTQNLGWCFWVGIAAISCQLIALALIIVYSLIIILRKYNCFPNTHGDTSSESGYVKSSHLYSMENQPEMSTPKIAHTGINDLKKQQKTNDIERKKRSQLASSPKFIKKSSTKEKRKSKKLSNNLQPKNQVKMNGKKHKHHHHLKAKAHNNHKYSHTHHLPSEFSSEKFRPGYSSEPDIIEYSLDRSWLNQNSFNQSLPENLDSISQSGQRQNVNEEGITNTFTSRHFVKVPKLVYYNGQEHYSRANNDQNAQ